MNSVKSRWKKKKKKESWAWANGMCYGIDKNYNKILLIGPIIITKRIIYLFYFIFFEKHIFICFIGAIHCDNRTIDVPFNLPIVLSFTSVTSVLRLSVTLLAIIYFSVSTQDQLANIFTKSPLLERFC